MSERNVLDFLHAVGASPAVLDSLKTHDKVDVLAAAERFGFPFTESEFNQVIWNMEGQLARKRGEEVDYTYPLWQTMWGQHYLEFLIRDLLPSLHEVGLV